MSTQANWAPYNVKALVRNVERVFKTASIEQLNMPTYQFITLHMGFIAHYNLPGFQDYYRDLRDFCQKLQTSEYSTDRDYNVKQSVRYEHRQDYGEAYNQSIAQAIRGIVAVARQYSDQTEAIFGQLERERDLAQVKQILTKYGLTNYELKLT